MIKKRLCGFLLPLLFPFSPILAFASGDECRISYLSDTVAMTDYAGNLSAVLSASPQFFPGESGFRTAGSLAEQITADYLAEEFLSIGVEDVEMSAVPVDAWETTGSFLTVPEENLLIPIYSYPQNGTSEDGLSADLIYVKDGSKSAYDFLDAAGKIVLLDCDANDPWICERILEAETQGALAVLLSINDSDPDSCSFVYPAGGTDILCAAISESSLDQLIRAIEKTPAGVPATLCIRSTLTQEMQTASAVIGKIPGKSSEHQIIFTAHYDTMFHGFQKDCSGLGLLYAMVSGILRSGYEPDFDLLLLVEPAANWGATDTRFGYGTASDYHLLENPDWAGKTIAVFGFDSVSQKPETEDFRIYASPEYASLISDLVKDSFFPDPVNGICSSLSDSAGSPALSPDLAAFIMAGIPVISNTGNADLIFRENDTLETYCPEALATAYKTFGSLYFYLDSNAEGTIDLTARTGILKQILTDASYQSLFLDDSFYRESLQNLEQELIRLQSEEEVTGSDLTDLFLMIDHELIESTLGLDFRNQARPAQEILLDNITVLNDLCSSGNETDFYRLNEGRNAGFSLFSQETMQHSFRLSSEESNSGNLFWASGHLLSPVLTDIGIWDDREETAALTAKALEDQIDQLKALMDKEALLYTELTAKLEEVHLI